MLLFNVRSRNLVIFSLFYVFSSTAFGLGGSIVFSGRIVEPACTVHTPAVVLNASDNVLPLNVYCHANQSARISFHDAGTGTGHRTFSGGVSGTEIAIHHGPRSIGPGESISYAFNGRKEMVIPFTATLRKPVNIDDKSDTSHIHGSMLVSFEYR